MKYYKIHIDYKNYIRIDETELEKAQMAFAKGVGAIFAEGATRRIDAILPDYNRMMGWNEGYLPTPEERGEIDSNHKCREARFFLADVKDRISLSLTQGQPLAIEG